MTYPQIANMLYGLSMVGLMAWALFRVIVQPSLIDNLHRSPSAQIWKALLFLIVGAVGLSAAAFFLGGTASMGIIGPLLLVTVIMTVISLAAWPLIALHDTAKKRTRWKRFSEFPIYLLLTAAWSLFSIQLANHVMVTTVDVEVTTSEDFVLGEIVSRPWVEFAAMTILVVILAVLEEFIFRGGIQGILEKTLLGVPGAIIIASLIWSLGHVGYLQPHGIKELQIFGLGVIFGIAKARHGLTWAVLLHVANNLFAMTLTGVTKVAG